MDETVVFRGRRVPKILLYEWLYSEQLKYEESGGTYPCIWSFYVGNSAKTLLQGQRRLRYG